MSAYSNTRPSPTPIRGVWLILVLASPYTALGARPVASHGASLDARSGQQGHFESLNQSLNAHLLSPPEIGRLTNLTNGTATAANPGAAPLNSLKPPLLNAWADTKDHLNVVAVLGLSPNGSIDSAILQEARKPLSLRDTLLALAGGTGGTATLTVEQIRNIRIQNQAVVLVLVVMYYVLLVVSAAFVFYKSNISSSVTFYCEPRPYFQAIVTNSIDDFMSKFNEPPKRIQLKVSGIVPRTESDSGVEVVEWNGEVHQVVFAMSFDLSTWIVRDNCGGVRRPVLDQDGVAAADLAQLARFLERDRNPMANVEVTKVTSWDNWEDLATNIKAFCRQRGFNGEITVKLVSSESVNVYKNRQWTNFMHSSTLRLICCVSLFGWAIYIVYMYLRETTLNVRAYYRVDVPIDSFLELIQERLRDELTTPPQRVSRAPEGEERNGSFPVIPNAG